MSEQLVDAELRALAFPSSTKRWGSRRKACEEGNFGMTKLHSLINRGLIEARKLDGKTQVNLTSIHQLYEALPRLGGTA